MEKVLTSEARNILKPINLTKKRVEMLERFIVIELIRQNKKRYIKNGNIPKLKKLFGLLEKGFTWKESKLILDNNK